MQASGKGGLQSPCPPGKGRSIYTSSLLPGPSSCIPVELKPVQLVCAGKCKSRADKGIPSFHGLRVARSPAAACLLLAPRRGGGGKKTLTWRPRFITVSSKSKPAISEAPSPQELAEPGQNQSTKRSLELAESSSPGQESWEAAHPHQRGSGTSSASTLLFLPPKSTAASGAGPCPPAHPHSAQPKGTWGSRRGKAPRGFLWDHKDLAELPTPPPPGSPPAIERPSSETAVPASRESGRGEGGGKKRQNNNENNHNHKTCTLGPVPLITTAKPHQGLTLLEGEKATQRCPAPAVLEVGDPHTLSSMAYGLRPRRGAWFFCSVIKSGAWSFPSIPRIARN